MVGSEWPGVTHLTDIRLIDDATVVGWRDKSPSTKHVVSVGGWRCQDLLGANPARKGLERKRSSLFWELVRCHELIRNLWRGVNLCHLRRERRPHAGC